MKRELAGSRSTAAVVVHDDPAQLGELSEWLRAAGLEPHAFAEADAALSSMANAPAPSVIVTALHARRGDGSPFFQLPRSPAHTAFHQVPVLLISAAFAEDEPKSVAADLGVEACLPWPVDGPRFAELVRAILEGRRKRSPPLVLIAESDERLAAKLAAAFEARGYRAQSAHSARGAAQAFDGTAFDVAVLADRLSDQAGDSLLERFRARRPDCICAIITSDSSPELALDWMRRGAAASLSKPFEPDFLVDLCVRARREQALFRVLSRLEGPTRELRESEERYRLLVENAGEAIAVAQEGKLTFVNNKMVELTGYSRGDLLELPFLELIHPEDRGWVGETHQRRLRGEAVPERYPFRYLRKDGVTRWAEINAIAIGWANRPATLNFLDDITERRLAEEKLRENEANLSATLNATADGILAVNHEGKVLFANGRFAELWDIPQALVDGGNDHALLDYVLDQLIDPEAFLAEIKRLYASTESGFDTLLFKDGRVFERLSYPLRPDRAESPGRVWSFRDVTERRRAEEERRKLQAQLNQAQKMESVGRLAGGVAHDFNNMLNVILGHTEMALDQMSPDQPIFADLREIRKAAVRSADLTRQLLAFARKQTIAPKILNLNETVESMHTILRRLIGEDIDLVWIPGNALWPVKVDPGQIDQILANLCVNSRDAIAGVGRITVRTGNVTVLEKECLGLPGLVPGDYVLLAVSDTGCGMDEATLSRLFEPFFTTKEIGKGTGLGLATVYGIVKQNGGFIYAFSEPGRGATFKVYLPRVDAEVERSKREHSGGPVVRGRENILLVEDEPAILSLVEKVLHRRGYTVLAAATPGEAIRLADEFPGEIHLLITDVVMSEMNGRDLARSLGGIHPGVKCLFMSGYTADVIARHGVLEPGVDFLQKPFSMSDLLARVRWSLDGPRALGD